MKEILEELYFGRIRPFEKTMPQCLEYEELQEKASEKSRIFEEKLDRLDPALRREYIQLTEAQTAADSYEYTQNFKIGFQLGARIGVAIFTAK